MSIDEQNVNAPDEGTEPSTVVNNGVTTITLDPNDPVGTVDAIVKAHAENTAPCPPTMGVPKAAYCGGGHVQGEVPASVAEVTGAEVAAQGSADPLVTTGPAGEVLNVTEPDAKYPRGQTPHVLMVDASPIQSEPSEDAENDAGLTDEDKEMVTLELTPQDFMIRMLGIDLAMAQIYPEPVYLATEADAADLLAREGLQYSFDSNRSLYLCGLADAFIEATLKDPDLRVLALRAIKFKYRRFDQPVEEAVKAVTTALRKQQHDIAAAQAAEAAAHAATDGAEQPQQ